VNRTTAQGTVGVSRGWQSAHADLMVWAENRVPGTDWRKLYLLTLALTSPTSRGRLVGIALPGTDWRKFYLLTLALTSPTSRGRSVSIALPGTNWRKLYL
jgi:hypothetical protein